MEFKHRLAVCSLRLFGQPIHIVVRPPFAQSKLKILPGNVRWLRMMATSSGKHAGDGQSLTSSSIDPKERANFQGMAERFWTENWGLVAYAPVRVAFIKEQINAAYGADLAVPKPLEGISILDVGCGGGILGEALAREGASVYGIDTTKEMVEVAKQHSAGDAKISELLRYEYVAAETLEEQQQQFDCVVCSEVIEHVANPKEFCRTLTNLAKPGAPIVITTINRTLRSYVLMIVGAEYITRMIKLGTHQWQKFITPEELVFMMDQAGGKVVQLGGAYLSIAAGTMMPTGDLGVNYLAGFVKK